jgi:predicted helicase
MLCCRFYAISHNDYIRALRWATDFLQSKDPDGEHGYLIAVICPDTWTQAQSGIQACIAKEFDKIWHIETRAINRFAGSEGDGHGIFGDACSNPIGIFFFLRLPKKHKDYTGDDPAQLFHFRFPDIPREMSRIEHPFWKRQVLDNQHPDYNATDCTTLCKPMKMNAADSWYAKVATQSFENLSVLVDGEEKDISVFDKSTTGADIRKPERWCNSSKELLIENLKVAEEKHKGQNVKVCPNPDESKICQIQRKPLFGSYCYWDLPAWRQFDSHPNQSLLQEIFPTPDTDNIVLGFNRQNVISALSDNQAASRHIFSRAQIILFGIAAHPTASFNSFATIARRIKLRRSA